MEFLATVLGILAVAMFVLSYQLKSRANIILFNAGSRVLYVAQYILLGAFEGALLDVIALFVSFFYKTRDKGFIKKHPTVTVIATNIVIFALGMLTYKNIFSLLPIFGVIFETLGLWLKKEKHIRILSIIGCPFWFAYNFQSGAYGSCAGDFLACVSLCISLIRYDILGRKSSVRQSADE